MGVKIEELYKKYLELSMPNKFLSSDAEDLLKSDYLAQSINKKEMEFLIDPRETGLFDKCFVIDSNEILENLYKEQEKSDFVSMKEFHKHYQPGTSGFTKMKSNILVFKKENM